LWDGSHDESRAVEYEVYEQHLVRHAIEKRPDDALLQPHEDDRKWLTDMASVVNQSVVEMASDHSGLKLKN
jgi:hypothetical protein